MRWISIVFSTLVLALSAASAGADALEREHDPRAAHAEADQNGDGQIDRREFHLRMVEIFFHTDADKDGFMNPEELDRATVTAADFGKADRDGDGKIAIYEFIEFRFQLFDDTDTDSNGMLSVEEVVIVYEG